MGGFGNGFGFGFGGMPLMAEVFPVLVRPLYD
jgi:hypothetical protein